MAKKVRRKLGKIARSITGFSTPVFGLNWTPPEDQRDIVLRLVTFLEDRRALYYEYHMEYGPWVAESVLKMREELTEALKACPEDENLSAPLKAMRAACRKFLDQTERPDRRRLIFPHEAATWEALGQLRGVFGVHLARLCTAYGIEVEPELASIFPASEDEEHEEA